MLVDKETEVGNPLPTIAFLSLGTRVQSSPWPWKCFSSLWTKSEALEMQDPGRERKARSPLPVGREWSVRSRGGSLSWKAGLGGGWRRESSGDLGLNGTLYHLLANFLPKNLRLNFVLFMFMCVFK